MYWSVVYDSGHFPVILTIRHATPSQSISSQIQTTITQNRWFAVFNATYCTYSKYTNDSQLDNCYHSLTFRRYKPSCKSSKVDPFLAGSMYLVKKKTLTQEARLSLYCHICLFFLNIQQYHKSLLNKSIRLEKHI